MFGKTSPKLRMEFTIIRVNGKTEKRIVGNLSLTDKLMNILYKIRGMV